MDQCAHILQQTKDFGRTSVQLESISSLFEILPPSSSVSDSDTIFEACESVITSVSQMSLGTRRLLLFSLGLSFLFFLTK